MKSEMNSTGTGTSRSEGAGLTRRALVGGASAIAISAPFVRRAHAEASEVKIAKQFGLLYLQQDIMEHEKLIEKHAAKLGLPGLKADFIKLAGTGAVTEALLSGSLQFASGGSPGAMLLWDRSKGAIKSCFAMNATNQMLLTVRPDLKTVKDLKPTDRIALPAVKTSPQAIFLQMAAAQAFGQNEWAKFDALTISRAHPDSMAQMLSDSEINCHWTSTPFQERELANPKVHEVANSFAIMGLPSVTPTSIYGASAFREKNPIVWKAVLAAFHEATDFIVKNPRQAAEMYLANSGDKDTLDNTLAAMKSPGNEFTLQPRGFQKMNDFMAQIGLIKKKPDNLTDLFFPEAKDLGGS
ncbi:MAG: ABC transporter substrate-binding protein [Rhodoblastus sp.]